MGTAPSFPEEVTLEEQPIRSPLPYLIANSVAWLAVVILVLHESTMLPAAALSGIVFSCGLSWLIYERSVKALEACDVLQYQLKLSTQTIDKLKSEVSDICQLDPLTQCFNQKRFREELGKFIALNERSGIRFSIIRLCLDQYADILGEEGQRGGNELLKVFSRILRASLREVDSVARFDGEQFAVLLSDSNATGAIIVANRITNLTEQLQTKQQTERITVSIGITEYHGTESVDRLIEDAETALALAVGQGGGCVAGYNYRAPEPLKAV